MIHPSATIDPEAQVHASASIWGSAHVREHASVGSQSIIGGGAYIGVGVYIGSRVKIQDRALIYEPAVVEDGAFIGPGVILTNDLYPRSITPDGRLKTPANWKAEGVHVGQGASIGAGAICIAPMRIGMWALIGAGSVVTSDVPDFALVVGNPARHIGWVGRTARRLIPGAEDSIWVCPELNDVYREINGSLAIVQGIP